MSEKQVPDLVCNISILPNLTPFYVNGFTGERLWLGGDLKVDLYFETGEPALQEQYKSDQGQLKRIDGEQDTYRISRLIGSRLIMNPDFAITFSNWLLTMARDAKKQKQECD